MNKPYTPKSQIPQMVAFRALGRLKQGERNKSEVAYEEQVLKPAITAGEVLWYAFEPFKIRIGANCFYTPDYGVMRRSGQLECHEVKGFWTDDARVKIKAAAANMPFQFIAITRASKAKGGGWIEERF